MVRVTAAALLTAMACTPIAAPIADDVEVTLSVSPDEVAVGEPIHLRVVARNTGSDRAELATNSCVLVVRLVEGTGDRLSDFPAACDDIGLRHSLDPGDSIIRTVDFDGTYRRRSQDGADGFEQVPLDPGSYHFFAGISRELWNRSEPVEVTVRE